MLSNEIYDFYRTLKRQSQNYSMSEVISELENFSNYASDLENKIDDIEEKLQEYENKIQELEDELSNYKEE